ncbi:MAG TPA: hypothetical protein VJY41_14830 [Prolixibacteraceae bacterium]|nr:hypothetical protein [Prolixibacteraceae bacterium]
MRTLILLLAVLIIPFLVKAQIGSTEKTDEAFEKLIDQYHGTNVNNDVDTLDIDSDVFDDKIEIEIESSASARSEEEDTIQIRVGKHNIEIRSGQQKTIIDVEKMEDFDSRWDKNEKREFEIPKTVKLKRNHGKFDGHWSGFDFGGNQLSGSGNTASYPEGGPKFLETSPEKSFEFNFNFAEYSFGFGSYVGIVTGLGLNFNDYKFKNPYTIKRDDNGIIQALKIDDEGFKMSKLSTGYITAPLMLEFQIPGNHGQDRLFVAAGVIGGLKIGEHTKTKIENVKQKNKSDHAIAPLRWGYTARVGFNDFGIYATYYNTPLFESGKGPEVNPFTLGATFTF